MACALAASGHSARWVSRVGADGFGDHLVEAIAAYGVDTSAVRRDPRGRPGSTSVRRATAATDAHEVALLPGRVRRLGDVAVDGPWTEDVWRGRGSCTCPGSRRRCPADCLALMRELTAPRPGRPLVSFDVNYRAGPVARRRRARACCSTWPAAADLVFVGEDEAEEAWGLRRRGRRSGRRCRSRRCWW